MGIVRAAITSGDSAGGLVVYATRGLALTEMKIVHTTRARGIAPLITSRNTVRRRVVFAEPRPRRVAWRIFYRSHAFLIGPLYHSRTGLPLGATHRSIFASVQ